MSSVNTKNEKPGDHQEQPGHGEVVRDRELGERHVVLEVANDERDQQAGADEEQPERRRTPLGCSGTTA